MKIVCCECGAKPDDTPGGYWFEDTEENKWYCESCFEDIAGDEEEHTLQ